MADMKIVAEEARKFDGIYVHRKSPFPSLYRNAIIPHPELLINTVFFIFIQALILNFNLLDMNTFPNSL